MTGGVVSADSPCFLTPQTKNLTAQFRAWNCAVLPSFYSPHVKPLRFRNVRRNDFLLFSSAPDARKKSGKATVGWGGASASGQAGFRCKRNIQPPAGYGMMEPTQTETD